MGIPCKFITAKVSILTSPDLKSLEDIHMLVLNDERETNLCRKHRRYIFHVQARPAMLSMMKRGNEAIGSKVDFPLENCLEVFSSCGKKAALSLR